jgi:hypothetical protein
MSAIVVAGDTSGSVTLNAPAVSGTTVIDLPSTSGTMLLSGGAGSFTTLAASGISTLTGNVGVGVTPVAWSDGYKAISCATTGNAFAGVASQSVITQGTRYDSGWKYTISSVACDRILLDSGTFSYANAPAGTSGNTATFTERMRINSAGRQYFFNAGSAATIADCIFNFAGTFAANRGISINATDSATNMDAVFFTTQSTQRGQITCSSSGTLYTSVSDYRLKENISPMVNALSKVVLLNPVSYTWKSDNVSGQGFIAHELQAVIPEAVTGEKDAVDAEGNPVYQGIDTSFLVATLTAAIQEQQALIENLTTRLAALENK